ncbi:hypothetical protein ABZP36_033148 [Zizania latifolia]
MEEEKPSRNIVLYAGMGVGHLVPMVKLAKIFLFRRFVVSIVVLTSLGSTTTRSPTISSIIVSSPSISFHILTPQSYPDLDPNPFQLMLSTLRLSVNSLIMFVRSIPSVWVLVLDKLCADAINSVNALHVPASSTSPCPRVPCSPPCALGEEKAREANRLECLAWLDMQLDLSVVFLYFRSMVSFRATPPPPRGVPRGDRGKWDGGQVMGAVGRGDMAHGEGRIRHALWLELDSRGVHCGGHAVLAAVRGIEAEQVAHRGGDEAARGGP